jgi:hypothetical protein
MLQSISSSVSGQPMLTNAISPIRKHTKIPSIIAIPDRVKRATHISKPSVGTIDEGRKVSFKPPSPAIPFPVKRRHENPESIRPIHSPSRSKSPTHVINEETGESSIIIGKASEVVEELQEGPSKEEEWRERLDKIDQRQERIEKMLERLVGDKYADVFSADDGDGA